MALLIHFFSFFIADLAFLRRPCSLSYLLPTADTLRRRHARRKTFSHCLLNSGERRTAVSSSLPGQQQSQLLHLPLPQQPSLSLPSTQRRLLNGGVLLLNSYERRTMVSSSLSLPCLTTAAASSSFAVAAASQPTATATAASSFLYHSSFHCHFSLYI